VNALCRYEMHSTTKKKINLQLQVRRLFWNFRITWDWPCRVEGGSDLTITQILYTTENALLQRHLTQVFTYAFSYPKRMGNRILISKVIILKWSWTFLSGYQTNHKCFGFLKAKCSACVTYLNMPQKIITLNVQQDCTAIQCTLNGRACAWGII